MFTHTGTERRNYREETKAKIVNKDWNGHHPRRLSKGWLGGGEAITALSLQTSSVITVSNNPKDYFLLAF
jgi:hypothetical protein